jgi:photosystem II stability/assembly factor-like uncharacterized protein
MLTNVDYAIREAQIRALFVSFLILFLSSFTAYSQYHNAQPKILWHGDTSLVFRGISALSDQVIWASSNQGVVVKTEDGGISWTIMKILGAEGIQFRDIHLFNEKTALIMGSGWPTRIYKTADAGVNWRLVYENSDTAVFLDGFDFWSDGYGICFGDPINNRFFMLKTEDKGEHWEEIEGPLANQGEAGFAASGTSLVCFEDSIAMFGSGGSVSNVFFSTNRAGVWESAPSELLSGHNSQGVFGMAYNKERVLFVGGDYMKEHEKTKTSAAYWLQKGKLNGGFTRGLPFQSAIVWYNYNIAISVGTPGCYFSSDFGLTWQKFTNMPLHTITKSRTGNAVFAAGPKGRIVKIVFE